MVGAMAGGTNVFGLNHCKNPKRKEFLSQLRQRMDSWWFYCWYVTAWLLFADSVRIGEKEDSRVWWKQKHFQDNWFTF